jgi:hypothetical protein
VPPTYTVEAGSFHEVVVAGGVTYCGALGCGAAAGISVASALGLKQFRLADHGS